MEGGTPHQGSWEVMAWSSSRKDSCRRRLDLRLQRLRGCSGLLEWTEEGEGEREVRAKDIFHSSSPQLLLPKPPAPRPRGVSLHRVEDEDLRGWVHPSTPMKSLNTAPCAPTACGGLAPICTPPKMDRAPCLSREPTGPAPRGGRGGPGRPSLPILSPTQCWCC